MMGKHSYTSEPSASLYEKILSCEAVGGIDSAILSPLLEALGATSAVFVQMFASPLGDRHFGASGYVGHDPSAVGVYVDEFHEMDPVMQPAMNWLADPQKPIPQILTGSYKRNLRPDSYYSNRFLQPYDIGHVLAMVVPLRTAFETQLACIGFHRRHEDAGFRTDQIAWFQRLAPAVRSVLHGLACREAMVLSETMALAAREAGSDIGFLVLDEDLAVRNGNSRGMDAIGIARGTRSGSDLLGAIKQRLLGVSRDDGVVARFRHDGARPLDIEIRNFRTGEGRLFHLAVATGTGTHLAIEDACRKFGLTDREAEVVACIAAGKCNASLSHELGISLRTGENHLRSIYRKVGVSSRTQLVSRLLQIH